MSSLGDTVGFVNDAFYFAPVETFVPENIVFGRYTFLPWNRTGVAQGVSTPAAGALRANVTVTVTVQGDGAAEDVTQTLVVRGPSDVLSISEAQVIRRYPQPGADRAEEPFLAHVEFDRPDLPWIFSPSAPAGGRLRPWIVLVVLRAAKSNLRPATGGLPARVLTTLSELQSLDDSWAWAHAQVVGPVATSATVPTVADRLTAAYGAQNLSRLICPRRLTPNESYVACVVPAYDAGVKAGLGSSAPGTLDPAWTRPSNGSDANNEIELPVFTSWSFNTGPAGDFRTLAEKLQPVPAPWQVGRRLVDMARPGGDLPNLGVNDTGRLQTVRGPLFSPQEPEVSSSDPKERAAAIAENASWPSTETEALRQLLNAPDELGGREDPADLDTIPLVGPEIYARHHAARTRVEPARDDDWFGEVNLAPVNRVVAGIGTRVVQRDQEEIMQSAWAQVGAIDDANEQLRRAQLARFVGQALHDRHLKALAYGALVQATRAVHARVQIDGSSTLHATINSSALPLAATMSACRRFTRPQGPLRRFAQGEQRANLERFVGDEGTSRDFRRPYVDLDGVSRISELAANALPSDIVAGVLGLDGSEPGELVQLLQDHGAALAKAPGLPDYLTPDAVAGASPVSDFRLQDEAGARLYNVIARGMAHNDDRHPTRVAANVALLGALEQTLSGTVVGDRAGGVADDLVNNRPIDFKPVRPVLDPQLPPTGPVGPSIPRLPDGPVIGPGRPGGGPVIGPVGPGGGPVIGPVGPGGGPVIGPVGPGGGPVIGPVGPGGGPVIGPGRPVVGPGTPRVRPGGGSPRRLAIPVAGQLASREIHPERTLMQLLERSSVEPFEAVASLAPISDALVSTTWPTTPERAPFSVAAVDFLTALDPAVTVTNRIKGRVGAFPDWLPVDWFDNGLLQPIMAAPVFTRPMYKALAAYDREWLIPGLAALKEPDVVTVLVSNAAFIEAFLVGLSHETGRELLWRGYPTDQRGTYFRRFWTGDSDELVQDVHRFAATPLGSHLVPTLSGRLVLFVRGELVRRYPNAIVMALRAGSTDSAGHPIFIDPASNPPRPAQAPILFHGHLRPDINLVGFDLTVDDVEDENWWFIIAEHPTAPRFGLDLSRELALTRETVAWTDMAIDFGGSAPGFLSGDATKQIPDASVSGGTANWGSDSAMAAHILLRDPVRAAFDAKDLLEPTGAMSARVFRGVR